jgi:hypothetical protein
MTIDLTSRTWRTLHTKKGWKSMALCGLQTTECNYN